MEKIAWELSQSGVKKIKIYNLSHTNVSFVLADIMRYKGLIIGGPTYSNSLFPAVDNLVKAIKLREIKNRSFAYFGSFTWAPAVTKRIEAEIEHLKIDVVASPFNMKQAPNPDIAEACRILAQNMAATVL